MSAKRLPCLYLFERLLLGTRSKKNPGKRAAASSFQDFGAKLEKKCAKKIDCGGGEIEDLPGEPNSGEPSTTWLVKVEHFRKQESFIFIFIEFSFEEGKFLFSF